MNGKVPRSNCLCFKDFLTLKNLVIVSMSVHTYVMFSSKHLCLGSLYASILSLDQHQIAVAIQKLITTPRCAHIQLPVSIV